MARLALLGTGTCELQAERAASAALIEAGGTRLVFDFGRGVAERLVDFGLRQDDVGHIVLSHFHPDHISDLVPYLHAALYSPTDCRSRDLKVYGPAGIAQIMSALISLVGFPPVKESSFRVLAEEVENRLEIGGLSLEYRSLPPAGNHGLRFAHRGNTYALTGDSHFHVPEVEFLRGTRLAVVDAGHLEDAEIVELAVRSAPQVLVCSHLYRRLDPENLNRRARARGYGGRILVGRDRMSFAL